MMLSRTANDLFWMGRYIERIEHIARYIIVQYYSSSDAPLVADQDLSLNSILLMTGLQKTYRDKNAKLTGSKVIAFLTLAENNPYSIRHYVHQVRENARGIRDNISTEVWETINRFYHHVNACDIKDFRRRGGAYDFLKHTVETIVTIKGMGDNTLLRDEVWSLIQAGVHLERAIQINQILIAKMEDLKKIGKTRLNETVENYIWSTLLRSAGGFDMSRRYYIKPLNKARALEFLLLNKKFPRSVIYNLRKLIGDLEVISDHQPSRSDSVEFMAGKLNAKLNFLTVEDILNEEQSFLLELKKNLLDIGEQLEKQYLLF
jgi:uncharacterized alpha-E superfamily protein